MGLFDSFKKKHPEDAAQELAKLQQQFDSFSMERKITIEQPLQPEVESPPPIETQERKEVVEEVQEPELIQEKPLKKEDDMASRLQRLQKKVEEKTKHRHDIASAESQQEIEHIRSKVDSLALKVDDIPVRELAVRLADLTTEKNLANDKILLLAKKIDDMQRSSEELTSIKRQLEATKESNETLRKQIEALTESADSFKNTVYMLNKKIEVTDSTKRVEQIEQKIKEIIVYLNKVTKIITKT